jgi:hypothetical protein
VIYLTSSFSVVGSTRTANAGPSLLSNPYVPWRDIMDPSAGSRPNPTGPPTRPGATAKPAWPGAASPSTGVPLHRTALPRATSGTRRNTRSSGPTAWSSGGFDPLCKEDDNSASTSSPLLLSAREDNTLPTGAAQEDASRPPEGGHTDDTTLMGDLEDASSPPEGGQTDDTSRTDNTTLMGDVPASISAVGAAEIGAAGTAGPSFVTQHEMSALLSVLLTVSSAMESVSSQMDDVSSRMTLLDLRMTLLDSGFTTVTSSLEAVSSRMTTLESTIRSLYEEVKSNHGHITKRLFTPLEARVAALEGTTVRLEDNLAAKGAAILKTVTDLHGTAASLTTVVQHATTDFGTRLSALETRTTEFGTRLLDLATRARTDTTAPRDPPPSDIPTVRRSPPVDATANSWAAWARMPNHVITPPRAPIDACHQSPGLRQTTLPGAFHPRHTPMRDEEDSAARPTGPAHFAPSPIWTHPTEADTLGLVGGPITSPLNWDKEMQAQSLGASRFDISRLACPAYHGGNDGTPTLTEDFIRECGFTCIKASADDIVVCYNDIIYVHQKVRELWFNKASNTLGPQVD